MNVTDIPGLSPEAHERIERAEKEAEFSLRAAFTESAVKAKLKPPGIKRTLKNRQSLLKAVPRNNRKTAALHYLNAIAWECIWTRSGAEFETLIGAIAEIAQTKFNGDVEVISAQTQCWIDEARDRTANGIGDKIPIRIDPKQARNLRELQTQFNRLGSSGPRARAWLWGPEKEIVFENNDREKRVRRREFEQLARRAMAALGFRFSDPSRTVDYWLDLLRQESPHVEDGRRISDLCFASAEMCREFETRALEAEVTEQQREPATETPAATQPAKGENADNRTVESQEHVISTSEKEPVKAAEPDQPALHQTGTANSAQSRPELLAAHSAPKVSETQDATPARYITPSPVEQGGPRRRSPDLQSSRERLDQVSTLARELATIKPELKGYCTAEDLKRRHPEFILWGHLSNAEIRELVEGKEFTPKAYAENLTLRKFGLTSRETLKKDRRKIREAQQAKRP